MGSKGVAFSCSKCDEFIYSGGAAPDHKCKGKKKVPDYQRLARKMARILMWLGAGEDEHDKAYRLVEKHFPDIYKEFS